MDFVRTIWGLTAAELVIVGFDCNGGGYSEV